MWSLCEICWILDPELRPSMKDLAKDIADFVRLETAQDAKAEDGTWRSYCVLSSTAFSRNVLDEERLVFSLLVYESQVNNRMSKMGSGYSLTLL